MRKYRWPCQNEVSLKKEVHKRVASMDEEALKLGSSSGGCKDKNKEQMK
jgi:hypothetical protein